MSQVFILHHCPQNGKSREAYRLTVVLRWFSSPQKNLVVLQPSPKKSAKQKDAWFLSCKILHTPAGTWFPKSGSNKSCFRVPSKRRIYLPVSWRLITVACAPAVCGTLVVTRMRWKGSKDASGDLDELIGSKGGLLQVIKYWILMNFCLLSGTSFVSPNILSDTSWSQDREQIGTCTAENTSFFDSHRNWIFKFKMSGPANRWTILWHVQLVIQPFSLSTLKSFSASLRLYKHVATILAFWNSTWLLKSKWTFVPFCPYQIMTIYLLYIPF